MLNMDQKLIKRQEEGKIIKTGIVGAGQMGRGMVTQMVSETLYWQFFASNQLLITDGSPEKLSLNTGRKEMKQIFCLACGRLRFLKQ